MAAERPERVASVLEFRLGEEIFCFDTAIIEYVYDLERYEPIDAFGPLVLGLARYNDDAMMLVDTHYLFRKVPLKGDDLSGFSVIVIRTESEGLYGMVVDEIVKIEDLERADLTAPMELSDFIVQHYKNADRLVHEIIPIPLLEKAHVPALIRRHKVQTPSTQEANEEYDAFLDAVHIRVGEEHYAIDATLVKEVVERESEPFAIDEEGEKIRGAVAIRGEAVPLARLGHPTNGTTLVVIENGTAHLAIAADEIYDIRRFERSRLTPAAVKGSPIASFINEEGRVIALVDPFWFIDTKEDRNSTVAAKKVRASARRGAMLVRIGGRLFGLPLDRVRQVVERESLPTASTGALIGHREDRTFLTTWQHHSIEVLDLCELLGVTYETDPQESLAVIVETDNRFVGLLVDDIDEVHYLAPDAFLDPDEAGGGPIGGAILTPDSIVAALDLDYFAKEAA